MIAAFVAFIFACVALGLYFRFRADRFSAANRLYFDRHQPTYIRNTGFALLPTAVGLYALVYAGVVGSRLDTTTSAGILTASLPLYPAFIWLFIRAFWKVPERAKPQWLKDQETVNRARIQDSS